jgi:arylesterase / paraoxonase
MRPAYRVSITAGSIALVAILALAFRTLNASGVFTDIVPGFAGTCRAIPGITGAEDIAIDERSGFAFVSAMDRRAQKQGKPAPQDGLYAMALTGDARLTKIAGTPADFHPHGISLYRAPDGSLTLMAINHRRDGTSSVDIFDVVTKPGQPVAAKEIGSIQGGQLVSPNAVAALDRDRFYVVNDHTSTTALGRMLDDDLVMPRANALYFNGMTFQVVADQLVFPGGVVLSPDGKYLYVTESYNRRLTTFERQPISGRLDVVSTLAIPSNLDNLRMDASGNLWLGSHPKAFAMAAYRSDPSRPAPSEVFKITLANGIPQAAAAIYTNLGDQIGASSVAAVTGHRLLIGSLLDTKILDCTMDH